MITNKPITKKVVTTGMQSESTSYLRRWNEDEIEIFPYGDYSVSNLYDHMYKIDGKKEFWYKHRENGPALIVDFYGELEYRLGWFLRGMQYTSTRLFCEACGYDNETTMFWLLKYGDSLPLEAMELI